MSTTACVTVVTLRNCAIRKASTVSRLAQALTDSAIRATAETVKPNRSSPFKYAGKSWSISDFFLTHATGSKILSQTPTYIQKKSFSQTCF